MDTYLKCRNCNADLSAQHLSKRYCDWKCKKEYLRNQGRSLSDPKPCAVCGRLIHRGPGQAAKSICSVECRKSRAAASVREFHQRKPHMDKVYRERTKTRVSPDSSLVRFYKNNPDAPRKCQSCGESRVLEVAHRPEFARLGERRSKANTAWPSHVWVLCPTCHRLLDRMNYSPQELGLT